MNEDYQIEKLIAAARRSLHRAARRAERLGFGDRLETINKAITRLS
jgi:hypothetical protein